MPATTNPFDLAGKDVWIFGGAGHLGQAAVALAAGMGAKVLCADLGGRAAAFVQSQSQSGITPAALDVCDDSAVRDFVLQQIGQRGVPDGVVVMTYASTVKRLEEITASDFDTANHGNLTPSSSTNSATRRAKTLSPVKVSSSKTISFTSGIFS